MFEDPIFSHYRTASRLSRMMLLSVAQWPSWNVMCGDVWHNGILIWKGSHKRIELLPGPWSRTWTVLHEGEEECI